MGKKRNPKGLGHYYYSKKDNLYCWKYTVDGQTIYRSSKTEKGLQEKVRGVIGRPIIKDKSTVSDWFENWLEVYMKPPVGKEATYKQYDSIYRNHIKPVLGNRKLSGITASDIQSVISAMSKKVIQKDYEVIKEFKDGNKSIKKIGTIIRTTPERGDALIKEEFVKLSKTSQNKYLSTKTMEDAKICMSSAFAKAEFEGLISTNPVKGIKIPKKQARAKKVLSVQELKQLYVAMKDSRWLWSVKFMLITGLRRGELLALRWPDIEWENSRVRVDESNSSTGLGDTKSAKVHYAPLSKTAIGYLENQIKMLINEKNTMTYRENNTRLTPEEIKKSNHLVFPSEKGDLIKANSYYHMLKRFGEKAGIEVYPHSLRHTFTFRMRNKLSLKELQNALGHDESTTTLDIYGDMIDDTMDKTASQIDDVFTNIDLAIENKKIEEEHKEQAKIINIFERRNKAK